MCVFDLLACGWIQLILCLTALFFAVKWKLAEQKKWGLKNKQIKWNAVGKDVVVLHQFPRARFCPNLSPYPLKLETFLRLHGIKYVSDFSEPMSEKNKSPWITINGLNIADSQLCIEYLTKKFNLDINKGLNNEELIVSRALRFMIEQDLYWVLAHTRWVINKAQGLTDIAAPFFGIPKSVEQWLITNMYSGMIAKQTFAQGMGRHTESEIQAMGFKDIECLSEFLGSKEFMFGKDYPTEIDCVLFGFMCMFLYCSPKDNIYTQKIFRNHQNLVDFTTRMKEKLWPDWNDCLYKE